MLDFDEVQDALQQLGANADASETHGVLCALLIDNAAMASWLAHTLDELPDRGDVVARERLAVLADLFEQTREQLDDEELAFELLLPDDSEDFGLRLMALSAWCQGFLYGYGVIAGSAGEDIDEQARECLSDLLEISKLGHDEEASEEAELQFAEIAEHVRMSTFILNESLNPSKASSTVH